MTLVSNCYAAEYVLGVRATTETEVDNVCTFRNS